MIKSTEKTTEQKTQSFFTTVEAGDIALFQPFPQAIAVFGFTKVGKTSSCHMLCNSTLRACKTLGGDLAYELNNQQYATAIVKSGTDSTTEIPNIFETRFTSQIYGDVRLSVLDQPGYGDSYGFHRILSNGYFHYRTFSKTPKLKFILAFRKSDLEGVAEYFKRTIQNFIKTFANYDQIRHDILDATVFLVTKANLKQKIEDITAILEKLKESAHNMGKNERPRYQEMIKHMIDRQKVFFIEKPESITSFSPPNKLLKQIYEKTEFWQRELEDNTADMSEINFSVANEILRSLDDYGNNEVFKQEYAFFMNFMMKRMKLILEQDKGSLKKVMSILRQDALKGGDEHKFLDAMKSFNLQFYKFTATFKEKRAKLEGELFNPNNASEIINPPRSPTKEKFRLERSPNSQKKIGMEGKSPMSPHEESMRMSRYSTSVSQDKNEDMKAPYFVRKFRVLSYIAERTFDMVDRIDRVNTERTIQQLQDMSAYFLDIFNRMDILRVERNDSTNIIYKYTYVIQRLIEEAKIITLILYSKSEHRAKFQEYSLNNKTPFVDIYRFLRDRVLEDFGDVRAIEAMKLEFCRKADLGKLTVVSDHVIDLFEEMFDMDGKLIEKVIALVLRYYDIVSKDKKANNEDRKKVCARLLEYRQKCYKFLLNLQKTPKFSHKEKEAAIEQIFALSNALSTILVGFNYYGYAREVYKSINNAEMVFKMYETELATVKGDRVREGDLLMKYGSYAWSACRKDLALRCYSQAYDRASSFQGLKEASQAIIKLQTRSDLVEEEHYLKAFYNENFCLEIPKSTEDEIDLICNPQNMNTSLSAIKFP